MGADAFIIEIYECGLFGKNDWKDSFLIVEVLWKGEKALLRIHRFPEKNYFVFAPEGDPDPDLLGVFSERLSALNLVEVGSTILFPGLLECSDRP